jgi:hypothetical protein
VLTLTLTLLACSADYPVATVTSESDSPVAVASELAAYVVEDPASGDGDGAGWIVMSETELSCADLQAFPEATRDESWLLYSGVGLAIYLAFDTIDDGATYLDWEDTYWGGEAHSPGGTRWMDAWAFTDGQRFALDGGWFLVERRRVDEFKGSFAVPWYAGDVEATHCGAWDDGILDTGAP